MKCYPMNIHYFVVSIYFNKNHFNMIHMFRIDKFSYIEYFECLWLSLGKWQYSGNKMWDGFECCPDLPSDTDFLCICPSREILFDWSIANCPFRMTYDAFNELLMKLIKLTCHSLNMLPATNPPCICLLKYYTDSQSLDMPLLI